RFCATRSLSATAGKAAAAGRGAGWKSTTSRRFGWPLNWPLSRATFRRFARPVTPERPGSSAGTPPRSKRPSAMAGRKPLPIWRRNATRQCEEIMLESVKIARRQSEIRQALAGLVATANPTADELRTFAAPDLEFRTSETRYRAALIREDTERRDAVAELETRSSHKWAALLAGLE